MFGPGHTSAGGQAPVFRRSRVVRAFEMDKWPGPRRTMTETTMVGLPHIPVTALQAGGGIVPQGSRVEVFQSIYWVFLTLGTLVGTVVIAYMLYNAYKYRDGGEAAEKTDVDRPQLGELPGGSGGGRKLFLSFALSAIIVISLIAWTYGTLLFVEQGSAEPLDDTVGEAEDPLRVTVVGYRFGWRFVYPNGHTVDSATGPLRVPADRQVILNVTSVDVWHNFGIPGLRVKTDAIPGQYTQTWMLPEEPGAEHTARCYELCGSGHSAMVADVQVMSQSDYQDWYEGTGEEPTPTPNASGNGTATATPTPTPTNETGNESASLAAPARLAPTTEVTA
jgi:cytochrome c oxidase subunit 2